MKNRLLGLLARCMVALSLTVALMTVIGASSENPGGECGAEGDKVFWNLSADGILTIQGQGRMADFSEGHRPPWFADKLSIRKIDVQSGISRIGAHAFENCENADRVSIPESVNSIGEAAFMNCDTLASVSIPDGVSDIGDFSFADCNELEKFQINANHQHYSVEDGVLYNRDKTILLVYPSGKVNAESDPESNFSATVNQNINEIRPGAFAGCKYLSIVHLSKNVTVIPERAFEGCANLSEVHGGVITMVKANAFKGCRNLKQVFEIPNSESVQWETEGNESFIITIPDSAIPVSNKSDTSKPDASGDAPKSDASGDAPKSDASTPDASGDTPKTNTSSDSKAPGSTIAFSFYNFQNSAETFQNYQRIPLSCYQLVYGNTYFARQQYDLQDTEWTNRAYGMAATLALLSQPDSHVSPADFRNGAQQAKELSLTDKNVNLNLTLEEFINAMQITCQSYDFCRTYERNLNQLSALYSTVAALRNGQSEPVIICLAGAHGSHTLLSYRLETTDFYDSIFVYDPNLPGNSNQRLLLNKDDRGNYEKWSYQMDEGHTWKNADSVISFIPYQTVLSAWEDKGQVENAMSLMDVSVSDCTVYNTEGKVIALFQEGVMTGGIDSSSPLPMRYLYGNERANATAGVRVWLSASDIYVVANNAKDVEKYRVSLTNVQQAISITTDSGYVKLSTDDSTVSGYVSISEPKREYLIDMISNLDTEFPDIRLSGTTAADTVFSVARYSGILSLFGVTKNTKLSNNKKEISPSPYYRSDMDSHSMFLTFDDVSKQSFCYHAVRWAVFRKITKGTSASEFSPQSSCNRQQILAFLWRANGSPAPTISNPFSDVDADKKDDFTQAALWAYEKGLVTGNRFEGSTLCKRFEAVSYLWKLTASPSPKTKTSFEDVSPDVAYADAVAWAVEKHITTGKSSTEFKPDEICTRGQIVTFLYRYYVEYAKFISNK